MFNNAAVERTNSAMLLPRLARCKSMGHLCSTCLLAMPFADHQSVKRERIIFLA
jgi:hypothetical protein